MEYKNMEKVHQNRMRAPSSFNVALLFILSLLLVACDAGSGEVYSADSASGGPSGPGTPTGPGTPSIPDTTSPVINITAPTGSSYIATSANVTVDCSATDNVGLSKISWSNSKGGSGSLSASGTSASKSFNIALLSGSNLITVTAQDAAGNTSVQKQLTVSYTPPTTSNTATLAWDPVSASNFSGYRVYYGTAPGAYTQAFGQGQNVGNVTTYVQMGLSSGTRYYFAVTANDSLGNESTYSGEAFKDIP